MTILNKALTRPAALWGVPLVPLLFTLCILTLAAVWSRFYWLLLLLIPAFIELRRLAKEDIHFFDLKLLAFKTRGDPAFRDKGACRKPVRRHRRYGVYKTYAAQREYPAVPLSPLVFPPARAGGEEQKR